MFLPLKPWGWLVSLLFFGFVGYGVLLWLGELRRVWQDRHAQRQRHGVPAPLTAADKREVLCGLFVVLVAVPLLGLGVWLLLTPLGLLVLVGVGAVGRYLSWWREHF